MSGYSTDPTLGVPEETREDAYRACATLRFAEGLRRRAPEARAEAAVQEAVAAAWLEGARVDASVVREAAMELQTSGFAAGATGVEDPALAWAMGTWRATWRALDALPDLNTRSVTRGSPVPVPGLLAGINRDVSSFLVASGNMSGASVAIPRKPEVVRQVVELVRDTSNDAIDRAGQIWRLLVVESPFEVGNTATAVAFLKWFLATSGVEPTGVSVISRWPVEEPAKYPQMLLSRSPEQVVVSSLVRGCAEGQAIALAVQAGRLPG